MNIIIYSKPVLSTMIVYVFYGKESDEPTIAKMSGLRIPNILTASGVKGE